MYYIDCRHDGLGKYRRVTGRDQQEAALKAAMQERLWEEAWQRETNRRNSRATRDAKTQQGLHARVAADQATHEAGELLEELNQVLVAGVSLKPYSWYRLGVTAPFDKPAPIKPRFLPSPVEPSRAQFVIQRSQFDFLVPGRRAKKEAAEDQQYQTAKSGWQSACEKLSKENAERDAFFQKALEMWNAEKEQHAEQEQLLKKEMGALESQYRNGEETATQFFFSAVLANSNYPDIFPRTFDVAFMSDSGLLLINLDLPTPADLPKEKAYRYIASRGGTETTKYTDVFLRKLYESIIYQTALRSIYEVFSSDVASVVMIVVFNGIVDSIDPSNGIQSRKCIVSIQVERDEFKGINLASVDPKACFRKLKGVSTSALSELTPIRPVLTLDKNDERFVEAYGVADSIDDSTNLAAMDWQDFENLIRELFEKEFVSNGGEVKITRASRDGGVDAVAFDPDPIRGGKIVIQAKRYTNVVGISAVRDLFGTVQHEGAMKGILVTTATFGSDAYEFANHKPITLISGAELLGLLAKHGHKARIDIAEARMLIPRLT